MAGTWTPFTNQQSFDAGPMILLADGRVLWQDDGTALGTNKWHKFMPDMRGRLHFYVDKIPRPTHYGAASQFCYPPESQSIACR